MISRSHLTALIVTAGIIYSILLLISGVSVTTDYLRPIPSVIGILAIVLLIFDKWIWKFPFLYPWFISTPDVSGTWKGQIISSWEDDKTEIPVEPIDAFLVIYQTFSSINIRMVTKESKSDLLSGNIIHNQAGPDKIAGIYNNIPNILIRERSPIHYGGLLLEIYNGEQTNLEGEYWTDRNTKGTLRFNKRVKKTCDNFSNALYLFESFRYKTL
jgi:hypothetical protein